jgi:nucleoside-diphosphate-sugar epimerase
MKVSICGCGWLGLPLAKYLVSQGFDVYGSKTSLEAAKQLESAGIHGIELTIPLEPLQISSDMKAFFSTDLLVINVPPRRRTVQSDEYIASILSLSMAAKDNGCKRIIFISTTSVYGSMQGEITESVQPNPDSESGMAHYKLEQQLRAIWGDDLVVLRLSGLIGPNRHPAKFLSGRTGIKSGNSQVNLIHLDDCIQAITSIIVKSPELKTLHLAAPFHPTREAYYTASALKVGLELPVFEEDLTPKGKVINSERTIKALGLSLKHPDLAVSALDIAKS